MRGISINMSDLAALNSLIVIETETEGTSAPAANE
jgi:hypothetical protein